MEGMERGREAAPMVARYVIDEGGVFILDRTQAHPLLKFDDSPEVWVLWPSRGPRGDIIYRNDVGEPMLRATRLGGMTVFTARRPMGSAAALAGAGTSIKTGPIGPFVLYNRLYQASVRVSRAAQHTIGFEAPDTGKESDNLIADAAMVAVEAFIGMAAHPEARSALARVAKISFVEGPKPNAVVAGGVLTITVDAAEGVAGRPSSRRIMKCMGMR